MVIILPNGYNSSYTGQHNDAYETRITALESAITSLNTAIGELNTALTNFQTTVQNTYLPLAGGTLTGGLIIANGADLTLKAGTTNTLDSGDIVFTDNSGTEKGRIYTESSASPYLGYRETASSATKYINNNLTPKDTYTNVSWTTAISTAASSWKDCLVNWVAPGNGWLVCYFNNGSNTPAAAITDNTSGFQVRCNGNGGRDFVLNCPVTKGHSYTVNCIYAKTNYARYFPSYG